MSRKSFRFFSPDARWGLLLALAVFLVYLTTLGPSIGFIDAGELAAVAHTFGIAHPTGYPLFTLVAGAFSHLPLEAVLGDSVIRRLNLFAALCCAASAHVFFLLFLGLLRRASRAADLPARLAAATAALTLAFSRTFWSQATGIEVYSLHLLMVAIILLLFLKVLPEDASPARRPRPKAVGLFAFALGLGFTNHMTMLLLVPALAWTYFAAFGWKNRMAWRAAGVGLPFFLAGLSLYLYLPLRASAWPALSWSDIVDLEGFYWHVTGKQYSGWMFSSLEPAGRNLALFLRTWPSDFGYAALAPALLGVGWLYLRARRLFVFTLLLFFGCLAYAINYDISDVANYFLLAHVATALAAAFGARAILTAARGRAAKAAAALACLAVVASPLALNRSHVDERGNYGVEDYARELLGSADPGAVLLTYDWDVFVAGAWYLQMVEGYRTDVVVVDRELLRRSWYVRKLRREHPGLTEGAAPEIEAFVAEVRKFERGLPYDPAVVQARFVEMVRSLLDRAAATRPVYVSFEIGPEYYAPLEALPAGGLLRVQPAGMPVRFASRDFAFRPLVRDNPYTQLLRRRYAQGYANEAIFLAGNERFEPAKERLRKALAVDPTFTYARVLRMQVESLERQSALPPAR